MPVRDIRAKIGIDGEKEFTQAVTEAGRSMRVMASEMKAATAEFDLSGDKMEYLGKRSKILNQQIEQQEAIIRALEGAVEDAADKYGEAGAKTDAYRIKLNNAQTAMAKLKKELEESNREMAELGRDAGRVGRQLEEGIGDAADDVSRKFDRMVNQLDQDLLDIKGAVEFSALADIGNVLSGGVDVVVSAVSGLTEGTLDYRRQMAILEQNAKDMGFDPGWLKQQAAGIAALTGDMDGAVEAVSNLARVAPDMDSFTLVMNRLLGAAIAWPDTLKVENLAESLQESLSGRQITGAYSELMTRLGMDIDKINKSLENSAKQGADAVWKAGTAWTAEHGFEETIAQYREAQKDMIAYNESKIKLTDAEARLAEKLTPVATAGIETFTGLIDGITGMIEKYETWWNNFTADMEESRKVIAEVEEEAKAYTSVEQFTEEIAKADAEGAYTKSLALIDARDRFMKAEIERQKKEIEAASQETQQEAAGMAQEIEAAAEQGFWESISRSMIGDYWHEYFFGDKESLKTDSEQVGKDIMLDISTGMDANAYLAENSIKSLMASLREEASKGVTIPIYRQSGGTLQTTSGAYYARSQTTNVTLSLNEKTLGKATVESSSQSIGAAIDRYEMYG